MKPTTRPRASAPAPAALVEGTADHRLREAFDTCPRCGALVLVRTWAKARGWVPCVPPVSAALGVEHTVEAQTCVLPVEDV
jgi:hypothetical protein